MKKLGSDGPSAYITIIIFDDTFILPYSNLFCYYDTVVSYIIVINF